MALGDQRKNRFMVDCLLMVKAIAPWTDISDELYAEYWASAYNAAGVNEITDADCLGFDISAATFHDFTNCLNVFNSFFSGTGTVWATEYAFHMNKMYRGVSGSEATPKIQYIATVANMVDGLHPWMVLGPNLYKEYWNNGYNTSITQLDCDPFQIALADFVAFVTLLENWNNMWAGLGAIQSVFETTILKLRRAVIVNT